MQKNIRIGVACLARKTYDFQAAAGIYAKTLDDLKRIPGVEWEVIPELVIEVEEAHAAAEKLSTKKLDGLVIITGTFHLGHIALILKKRLNKPVLLWAFNELPYNGGKIRLNSLCGLNLNTSNLYKAGFDDVSYIIGDKVDIDWIDAVRMKAALETAHIGIIGYHADGFFNLGIDEMNSFSSTGILVDHYEISDMLSTEAPAEETDIFERDILKEFDCSGISKEQRSKVAALCAKMERFIKKNRLTALAVRCWPEFANIYGISPCASMSILQSKGFIIGCEGDIEGVMSMLICDAAQDGQTPFLADLSQVDFDKNCALLWHCGVAPKNLWDGVCIRSLDTYFAGGRGVTAGFVLKPGRVIFVRIDSARGRIRLYLQSGTVVPMEKELTGTYGKVVFDKQVKEVLDTVISTGVAHHLAMVYSERIRTFEIFSKIMGYKLIG